MAGSRPKGITGFHEYKILRQTHRFYFKKSTHFSALSRNVQCRNPKVKFLNSIITWILRLGGQAGRISINLFNLLGGCLRILTREDCHVRGPHWCTSLSGFSKGSEVENAAEGLTGVRRCQGSPKVLR